MQSLGSDSSAAAWEQVGTELRVARERRGMSLHDLAARTRIKASLLDALERGEVERLPRGPFPRGFARAYAAEVGLDAEALLSQCRPEPITPEPLPLPASGEPVLGSRAAVARLAASAAVVLAALIVPRWMAPPEDAPVIEQVGVVRAVGTAGVLAADAAVSDAPAPATQPQAPVTLVLRATSDLWIEAAADGSRVAYDLLPAGAEVTLAAQNVLSVRIGDAGAVEYTVNGVRGIPLGGRGDVRDIVVSPDTLADFQAQAPQ